MTGLLAALGIFLYSDQPILTAAAMDIVREGTAATTLGLLSTSRFILSALSPIIATWLYGIDAANLFYYTAVLYLAAAVILAVVRLPSPSPVAHDDHDGGHHDDHGHNDDHDDDHAEHGDHGHHDGHGDHGHRH